MVMLLLAAVLLPTPVADYAGALLAGHPSLGPTLHRIALRESRGQWVGLHDIDARHGAAAWRNAVRVGWLDPKGCHFHARGNPDQWSTTGVHGQISAYGVRWLGCVPPWVLSVPVVSAFVAAKRAGSKRCGQVSRCRSWRGL